MLQRVMAVALLLYPALVAAQQWPGLPKPPDALAGEALVRELRGGGYVFLFRHGVRDIVREREGQLDLKRCETQSNLAPIGIAQSKGTGAAMKQLRIPIAEAYASPMCRTMDTARYVSGRDPVAEEAVRGDDARGIEASTFKGLESLIAKPLPRGSNRVIVGHVSAFAALNGIPHLQEGEAAVYRMKDGKRTLVARLRAEDWKALAAPIGSTPAAQRSAAPDADFGMQGTALLNALRSGGYALYFRHAATDFSQRDLPSLDTANCTQQRNLSEAGRAQARAIGEALRSLQLPEIEVVASPYCRTMESAKLIAGPARAEDAIRGTMRPGGAADYSALDRVLSMPVEVLKLRVIVGHGEGFVSVAGQPRLEEGEAAVVRAVAGGGWVIVARLRPDDWKALLPPAPKT